MASMGSEDQNISAAAENTGSGMPLPMMNSNENTSSQSFELYPALAGEKRPLPRGTASYPRKRAVTACQACRARRIKCDNQKPSCSSCLKSGARCIQSSVDLSSFDAASLKILERLDVVESAIGKCQSTVESIGSRFNHSADSSKPPGGVSYPDIDRSRLLPPSMSKIGEWPSVRKAGMCQSSEERDPGAASASTTPPQEELGPEPMATIDDLPRRFIKALVDQFFEHVHVKNPVLEETQTRKMITRLCRDGVEYLDWSAEACLVLLVLALGSTATPFEDPEYQVKDLPNLPYARSFYKAAQKRLWIAFSGTDRVLEAQCFFLSGVYAMTMFQPEHAWRFFLQALALCQGFKFLYTSNSLLERQHNVQTSGPYESSRSGPSALLAGSPSSSSPTSTSSKITTEQAIYWSAWKSERELRGFYETRDFALSESELGIYPPFFPTPPVIDENDTSPGTENDRMQYRERLSWYFYLSEISLRRLSACIANGIVQFQPTGQDVFLDGLAKATLVHETQAEEWAAKLPSIVSISGPPEEDNIGRFVLRGHLVNLYEIIYWPFVDALINGVNADGADESLIRNLAHKGLENHVNRLFVNQPGYKHRHHGTLFLLNCCSRSALVLIAAAASLKDRLDRNLEPNFTMPDRWHEAVRLAIGMNRYWETESADSEFLGRLLEAGYINVQFLDRW